MNASRVIAACVLALSSSFLFPMITMEKGENDTYGSYICYKKSVGQGHSLLYFNFEDAGVFRICRELVDVNNPAIRASEILEENFGENGEFWNIAKEYKAQGQKEVCEGKENTKSSSSSACKGQKFDIEWYSDAHGTSQACAYYEALSSTQQNKLKNLFDALANTGKIQGENRFRNEGDGIFAFKPMPDRFLCFFHEGRRVVVTNAFEKRTDKLDPAEKALAVKARLDYTTRCKTGTYYKE